MKKNIVIIPLIALALSACEVSKDAVPIGGSRADGTVVLGYTVAELEIPKVDWAVAQKNADKRCQAWGYKRSEAFEGEMRNCVSFGYGGCSMFQVQKTYQCLSH